MTSQNKIVAVLMAVVAIVLIVLGASLRWPAWGSIVAVLGSCGVIVAAAATTRGKPTAAPLQISYEPPPPPPTPEPPEPVQTVVVQGVNLASAWPNYEFILDVTVYWRLVDKTVPTLHVRPGATAVDMIIRQAADVAAAEEPGMAVRLQHHLNDMLGVPRSDPSGRFAVWADQVRTTLSDRDVERLRSLSDIRKDKAVWEHQRRYETDRREYLTDDVLKSTGSAVVWWLSRHESDVTEAVNLIGTMARLSAAARNEEVAELFRHLLPESALPVPESTPYATADGVSHEFGSRNGFQSATDFVTGLMDSMDLDSDGRALFAERVAMDISATGNEDVARQIRHEFGVITEQFADDQEPDPMPEPEADARPESDAAPEPDPNM